MNVNELRSLFNILKNNYDDINDILYMFNLFSGNINSNLGKVLTFISERKFISVFCYRDIGIPKSSLIDIMLLLNRLNIIIPLSSLDIIESYNTYLSTIINNYYVDCRISRVYEIREEFYDFFKSIKIQNNDVIRRMNSTIEKENKFIEQVENKEIKVKTIKKNNVEFYKIIKSEDNNNINNNKNTEKIWNSIYKEIKGYLSIPGELYGQKWEDIKIGKRKSAMDIAIKNLKVHDQLNDEIINFISKKIDIMLGIENEIQM